MNSSLILRLTHFSIALVLMAFCCATVFGQGTAARPDRGITPGAAYSVSDFESISLSSGNVNLSIPLASLPPIAGGKLKFTLSAVYNSKLWNITRQENQLDPFYGCPSWMVDQPQLSELGGWRITGGYNIQIREGREDVDYIVPQPPSGATCESNVAENNRLQHAWYRVVLITPDGAEHDLRPIDSIETYVGTRAYLWGHFKDTPQTLGAPIR